MDTTHVRAPGRICLFGEHQDFLGLAVIATPISLYINVEGTPREDTIFRIEMPDVGESDEFDGAHALPYRRDLDFLRAATNVLRRQGVNITRGHDCTIWGNIPINSGTSSSSALVVSWVKFLLSTQETDKVPEDPESVARYAYLAEVPEFNAPGGMMDHYTSAVGGLLYIDCQEPITVEPLPAKIGEFVLGDTGVRKNNNALITQSRSATTEGIEILKEKIEGFDFRSTPYEEAKPHIEQMPTEIGRRVRANMINRDICQEARWLLSKPDFDSERVGELLYQHQAQLRDGVGVSHPRLDELIDAAMEAGALGGKLNGAGGGGCMFAYAPGCQEEVAEAIEKAGGTPYIVSRTEGARLVTGSDESNGEQEGYEFSAHNSRRS
ncbi:MAG: galactokinase family protein [Armatimonadota bacterium]